MRTLWSVVGIAVVATNLVGCGQRQPVGTAVVAEDGQTVAYLVEHRRTRGFIKPEVVWKKTTLFVGETELLSDPGLDRVGQLSVHVGAETVALSDGRLVSFDGTVRHLPQRGPYDHSTLIAIAPDGEHVALVSLGVPYTVSVYDLDTVALVASQSVEAPPGLNWNVHFRDVWSWTPDSQAFVVLRDFKDTRATESYIVAVGELPAKPFPTCAGPMSTTDGTCTKNGVRVRTYGHCQDYSSISRVSSPPRSVPDCAVWSGTPTFPFPR